MMHSVSSPLPVLLLSDVVGDIHKGCYLLLWVDQLRRPSHLRQYLQKKKTVHMFNKNLNIPRAVLLGNVQVFVEHSQATPPFLITYTMTINPSLLERLPRLIPGDSGTWCLMMSSSQTLEVRPSISFPIVQSAQMMVMLKSYIHSHVPSHSHIHTQKIT